VGQPRPDHRALGRVPQAVTVNLRLGDVMPLLSSATGRCFAAYVSRDAIAPMLRDEMARAQKPGAPMCRPPWPK
jgi:DNA-binding IclR family transcriptional regulator